MLTTCDPGKIEVIPNPVSETIYYQSKDFNETCPLLLFIGIKPNKNLERTCEALQHLNCRLLVIGKLSEKQEYLLKEF